jgi:hypothetical protein
MSDRFFSLMMRRKLILVLVLLGLAAAIAIFVPRSRRIGTVSVDSLRTIYTAQVTYAQSHLDKGFASSLADLGPSPGAELIDSVLATGRKSGYVYTLIAAPPEASGRIMHYTVVARPEKYEEETRGFFIDESGVARFTTENRAATVSDAPSRIE